MKKRISLSLEFLVIALSLTHICYSQDIIILKNGDEIKSKVLEVLSDQVKYKKWDNIEGPSYSSLKSEIFMIKYQNGTKDVFKTPESVNTNVSLVSSEDIKKADAVVKLENYVRNKITGQVIKFDGFRKTNGVMNNVFGQMVYSINFDVDIKFVTNGWLKGNDLEGWWSNNFYVYPSQPNLSAAGEQYMYGTKLIPIGTFITLGCVAEMKSTDNGFMVESLSIRTVTNHGIVASTNQNNNNSQNQSSNTGSSNINGNAPSSVNNSQSSVEAQRRTPEERTEMIVYRISDYSKLSKAQQSDVDTVYLQYFKAQDKLREGLAPGTRPERADMDKLSADKDAKLKIILTEGQFTKLKEMEAAMWNRQRPLG